MSRSRILSSIAAATVGIALLGACSAESLTERAASFGLEQAIEGDQDINLDFGEDGSGGFSITTDEGDFSLNFDEDNGGIVFNTDEGDGVISFDEDGIVFNTDEGDGVISFDEDGIVFDTDEGAGSINFDDNGNFQLETEEGSLGITTSQTPPANWPAAFGTPATLVPGSETYSILNLGDQVVTTGIYTHDRAEIFGATVIATLKAQGWTELFSGEQAGVNVTLTNNDDVQIQVVTDNQGYSTITITQPGN